MKTVACALLSPARRRSRRRRPGRPFLKAAPKPALHYQVAPPRRLARLLVRRGRPVRGHGPFAGIDDPREGTVLWVIGGFFFASGRSSRPRSSRRGRRTSRGVRRALLRVVLGALQAVGAQNVVHLVELVGTAFGAPASSRRPKVVAGSSRAEGRWAGAGGALELLLLEHRTCRRGRRQGDRGRAGECPDRDVRGRRGSSPARAGGVGGKGESTSRAAHARRPPRASGTVVCTAVRTVNLKAPAAGRSSRRRQASRRRGRCRRR